MEIYEITSAILKELAAAVKPGITTLSLDKLAGELIHKYGVTSINMGYKPTWADVPYPSYTCINVNSIICHGIPSKYKLKEGDICSIDIGIEKDGQCGDAALTVPVGKISPENEKLILFAKAAVYKLLSVVKAGVNTEEIAKMGDIFIWGAGYVANRRFCGHGIGEKMHMLPKIYNSCDISHNYAVLEVGQRICVEVPITLHDDMGIYLSNRWTVVTQDRENSAFFEHMVEVTEDGYKLLTNHF